MEPCELLLLHHAPDTDLLRAQGNHPKPFVREPHDDRIVGFRSLVQPDTFKMSEDRDLFMFRVDDPQALLVAREIAAPARVDEKRTSELMDLARFVPGLDGDPMWVLSETSDSPSLAHIRSRAPGMLQQDVVQPCALDLKRCRQSRKPASLENEFQVFARVAQVKLRPVLHRESRRFESGQHPHPLKQFPVVRQKRFANVKPWKVFLLQHQHAPACLCQECRRRASPRTTPNHHCVICHFGHRLRKHTALLVQAEIGDCYGFQFAAIDIFDVDRTELMLSAPFICGANTHGTGCTYSAAITGYLARGLSLDLAVQRAKDFITNAIASSQWVAIHSVLNWMGSEGRSSRN